MRGKKAKLLRRVANVEYAYDTTQDRELSEVVIGKRKILQINRDGSTEEVIGEVKMVYADMARRKYKALKRMYKTYGMDIFNTTKGGNNVR